MMRPGTAQCWRVHPVLRLAFGLLLPCLAATGCGPPKFETIRAYPPAALPVRYAPAMDKTECLVAAAVMAGNYVLGTDRLTTRELRDTIETAGRDHTLVRDMQQAIEEWGLEIIPLRGTLRGSPPVSLEWWVVQRGYPVICVINQSAGQPDYNHAVVVIGIESAESRADSKVYVLDPSVGKWLLTLDELTFLHVWGSAGRVMLPMVEKPVQSGQGTAEPVAD